MITQADLTAVTPVLIVVLAGCAVLLAEAIRKKGDSVPAGLLGIIGLAGAAITTVMQWGKHAVGFGVILADDFALFVNLVLCGVGILTILLSSGTAERDKLPESEYHALMLFSIAGMMLMGATRDLLIVFIALEILSLGVYVLTGIKRGSEAGAEGAFKYFVLGAFSSAFFLYGIALAYAATGSTKLDDIGLAVASSGSQPDILLVISMMLLLVG